MVVARLGAGGARASSIAGRLHPDGICAAPVRLARGLYLHVVTMGIWGGTLFVPSRWRVRASAFAAFLTLWGLFIAMGLDFSASWRSFTDDRRVGNWKSKSLALEGNVSRAILYA